MLPWSTWGPGTALVVARRLIALAVPWLLWPITRGHQPHTKRFLGGHDTPELSACQPPPAARASRPSLHLTVHARASASFLDILLVLVLLVLVPQEGAGHAVVSAYVELVIDNSDGRFPVSVSHTYTGDG